MGKLGSIKIKLEVWKLLTGLRFSLGVTGMDKIRRLRSGDRGCDGLDMCRGRTVDIVDKTSEKKKQM